MLEAVNSVIQTAPLVRAQAEQVSVGDSFAANPERVQRVPQAPFVSLYVHVDTDLNKAVLQIRDNQTGDVEGQLPSEASLQARARIETAALRVAPATTPQISAPQTEATSAQAYVQKPSYTPAAANEVSDTTVAANAATAQQQAAFSAAARAGNTNAGTVTLFA